MKNLKFLLLVVAMVSTVAAKPMNVVFILADDLGWSDITLYGTTELYETPNLERLAKRGMTFTQAYAASPICSPTRASILTGRSPARTGFTAPSGHKKNEVLLKPELKESGAPYKSMQLHSVSRLDTQYKTLGKMLKNRGYSTGHFGKWHLGWEPYSALEHGFDIDIPHHSGPGPSGGFVAPWKYDNLKANYPKEHIEDRMSEEALTWLKSVPDDKPFFMNYWQFSVHAPFDAKVELIEKYRSKIDPDSPQRSAIYAAMVESMDDSVGTLLDAVDAAGIADNTVIIFFSDNGGNMYNLPEGVPQTSNAPLRGGKSTLYEGGLRVPCVVVWPGVTEPGSRSDEIIQSMDFYPTLMSMLNIPMPKDYAVDGIDITPALKGGALDRTDIVSYFPHFSKGVPDWIPPAVTIRSGDWKLIRMFYEGENNAHRYMLYNLKEDIGETKNLASNYPEKVQMLDRKIEDYLKETQAFVPPPNPHFDPKQYAPEKYGISTRKIRKQKASTPKNKGSKIDGWQAGGTCSISKGEDMLVIKSSGRDPYITLRGLAKTEGGPFTVSLRMRAPGSQEGTVYYNEPASGACTASFALNGESEWQEVKTQIAETSINGLRLDPSRAAGTVEIDWIRLLDQSGTLIKEWNF